MRCARAAAFVLLASCAGPRVRAWPVEPRNPTAFTFDIPVADARVLVLEAFLAESWPDFWAAPAEGGDIRIGYGGVPGFNETGHPSFQYLSPVYHSRKGPLPMIVSFRLHLSAPSPERTTVEVTAEGTRVIAGKTSGFLRVHGPAMIVRPAEPTTVEEYTILRRCGSAFGVRDMPETTVPVQGVEALVETLVNRDADEFVRNNASNALAFLGGTEVTRCLVAALERDEPGAEEAARTLQRLGGSVALPALRRALESRHARVRESAADAIRAMRPAKGPSLDDLVADLDSRFAVARLEAAIALVSTGREIDRARPVLEPFLESEIPSERWRAAAALVRLRRLADCR